MSGNRYNNPLGTGLVAKRKNKTNYINKSSV